MFSVYSLFSMILYFGATYGADSKESFCDMSTATVSRAFGVQNDIYFGDNKAFWKISLPNLKIEKKETIQRIFGESIQFKGIDSAVHFGTIDCDSDETPECADYEKALNLLLVIGQLSGGSNKIYGYIAYKANSNAYPTPIWDNNQLLWGLKTNGTLNGNPFFRGKSAAQMSRSYRFSGFTFLESKMTFYESVEFSGKSFIRSKILPEDADFRVDFIDLKAPRVYEGLIDWDEQVYGLANNKFYLLSIGAKEVLEKREFSAKQFLCDGNSPLKTRSVKKSQKFADENSTESSGAPPPESNTGSQPPPPSGQPPESSSGAPPIPVTYPPPNSGGQASQPPQSSPTSAASDFEMTGFMSFIAFIFYLLFNFVK